MEDDYEDKGRRVLEYVIKCAPEGVVRGIVTRRVHFDNDDVPNFIREMRKFQRDSRKRRILAGCYSN